MTTEANRLFDALNRRYWRGRLPRYRVIRRSTVRSGLLGLCDNKARVILLAAHPSAEDLRDTLLHEMCHIGTGSGFAHGPRFLRKVRRLVRLGESKLLGDVERYDGTAIGRYIQAQKVAGREMTAIPFRDALMSDIEAAAFSEFWRRRWATIARGLATQYSMTAAQLRRVAPWAERRWQELVADRRFEERARKAMNEGRMLPEWKKLGAGR